MRVYAGVHHRRGTPADADERLRSAARRALPFTSSGDPDAAWSSPDGSFRLVAWTNEPPQDDRPLLAPGGEGDGEERSAGCVGFSGYLHGPLPEAREVAGGNLDRGGVWSVFAASPQGLVAQTCASGAEMVFRAETPETVVVGNRALLVHLLADPSGPHADLLGLAGVFNSGYCVTTRTAFRGVTALPLWSALHVTPERVSLSTRDARSAVADSQDVAEALLASVAPLAALDRPVRLGLTGGRDSRLLVALLWRAGVPVNTQTAGTEGDPDVVVAREVARMLGVPHKVGAPLGAKVEGDEVTVDVRRRLKEAVVLGEGMLTAYDRVGRIDDTYNASLLPFSGSGGEILRAYFAAGLKDLDDVAAGERLLRGRVLSLGRLLNPAARAGYERDLDPWFEQVRSERGAATEDFFVRQRTARWTGAARGSASIGSLAQRPYLDHLVVRTVRGVPIPLRTSERLIAELLEELAPQLHDVRFAGRRWKFDEKPPNDPGERRRWEERAPVASAHGDQASFNWRTDLPEVRAELAEVVMDAPDEFWDLADRARVTEFVTRRGERSRGDAAKLWHLATVATALATRFDAGEQRFDRADTTIRATRPPAATEPVERSRVGLLVRRAKVLVRTARERRRGAGTIR